jgi:hypothetical protein
VCCMYATKEAIIAREHASDIKPTIFYSFSFIHQPQKGREGYPETGPGPIQQMENTPPINKSGFFNYNISMSPPI